MLAKEVRRASRRIIRKLDAWEQEHPNYMASDPLLDRLTKIFENRVGAPFSAERLESIRKEAVERYKNQIPPGYEDAGKPEGDDSLGDLIIWLQMIDHANACKCPVIFLTDEKKPDWWLLDKHNRILAPRPELREEMRREAGVDFYQYRTEQFLDFAEIQLSARGQQKAAEEVRDVTQQVDIEDAVQRVLKGQSVSEVVDELLANAANGMTRMGALAEKALLNEGASGVLDQGALKAIAAGVDVSKASEIGQLVSSGLLSEGALKAIAAGVDVSKASEIGRQIGRAHV